MFAALVAIGCRAFGSDLGRVGWIGIALVPVLVTGAWEVALLFWLTAVLCCLCYFLLGSVVERKKYRPSIQTLMASTFLAALAGLIIRNTGLVSRPEILATLLAALASSVWATQAVSLVLAADQSRTRSRKTWAVKFGLFILVGAMLALSVRVDVSLSPPRTSPVSELAWRTGLAK